MPAVNGEISIVYGSLTVGGTSDYLIDGPVFVEEEYTRAAVEFAIVITGTTATLQTAAAAVEAAFRKPRQDLTVTLNGTLWLSLKQSDNTGLDAEPRVMKVEDLPVQTGNSRRYRIRIEFGMPADNISTSGRRYSSVALEYGPQRRMKVTISGVWTAVTGTAAYTGYVANIEAYVTTVLSGIGGSSWEKLQEPEIKRNETDKVLEWVVVWQERIDPDAGQSATTTDDTVLVDQKVVITRSKEAPGDSPSGYGGAGGGGEPGSILAGAGVGAGSRPTVVREPTSGGGGGGGIAKRFIKLIVQYDAEVVKGTNPRTKYDSTVRADLFTRAQVAAGTSAVALVKEDPAFDPSTGHLSARLEFWALGASRILEQHIVLEDIDESFGKVPVAAWTGNPRDYYVYDGPSIRIRQVTERKTVSGFATNSDIAAASVDVPSGYNFGFLVSKRPSVEVRSLGLDNTITVSEIVVVTVMQFVNAIAAASKSGDKGGSSGAGTPSLPGGIQNRPSEVSSD